MHSPWRSSWRRAADPGGSSYDASGSGSASAGGLAVAQVARILDAARR